MSDSSIKYERQLLTEIHKQNHTRIVNKEYRTKKFVDYHILPFDNSLRKTSGNTYHNLDAGFYFIVIDIRNYFFILDDAISGNDDKLVIWDFNKAFTYINGVKKFITLHVTVPYYPINIINGNTLLDNVVNAPFNNMVFGGRTDITYPGNIDYITPYNPSELESIKEITIHTENHDGSKTDNLQINLKNNIKRLPNGIMDLFAIDSLNCRAFIIFKIGRLILTGNEDWVVTDDGFGKDYCEYFLQNDIVATGVDDKSLLCNYFPTVTYTEFTTNTNNKYCIAMSNDSHNTGFYLRVPKDIVEPDKDGDNLRSYFRECLMKKPIIIEFLLKNHRYKSVLLDEYHVKAFYPKTYVHINHDLYTYIGVKGFGTFTETRYKNTTALQQEV